MSSTHHFKSYRLGVLFITLLFCGWGCQKSSSNEEKTLLRGPLAPLKAISKKKPPPILGQEIILKNIDKIGPSRQVILVTTQVTKTYRTVTTAYEKVKGKWEKVYPPIASTIGERGFAKAGQKIEGDLKTPTGVYPLVLAFGYAKRVVTGLPYRQATENDYWVDDPKSRQYNRWVRGKPKARSYELMKREDHQYEYGIVVGYNVKPIVKGKGSALFFHVWPHKDLPSIGCITMPAENMIQLLRWLDKRKKPVVIMGPRDRLLRGPL